MQTNPLKNYNTGPNLMELFTLQQMSHPLHLASQGMVAAASPPISIISSGQPTEFQIISDSFIPNQFPQSRNPRGSDDT